MLSRIPHVVRQSQDITGRHGHRRASLRGLDVDPAKNDIGPASAERRQCGQDPFQVEALLLGHAGSHGQVSDLAREKGNAPLELDGLDVTVLDHKQESVPEPVTQIRIPIL